MGVAAVDSASCSVVIYMLVVMVLQLGLVSVYSIDDAASMLLAVQLCTGRALVEQSLALCCIQSLRNGWYGCSSVRMSACVCS